MKLRVLPSMYALSPAVKTCPLMPCTMRAVCSAPPRPHQPMSPAPTNVCGAEGIGVGVGVGTDPGGSCVPGVGVGLVDLPPPQRIAPNAAANASATAPALSA